MKADRSNPKVATASGRDGAPTVHLAGLSPAYFGMVMATGIVSLAAHLLGAPLISKALFNINIAAYAVLWVLTLLRMARYPRQFFGDMVDHARGTGYFTMVAATGILASQCIVLLGHVPLGFALWALAALLWLVLTYTIFTAFTIRRDKPPLDRGISGAWLLAFIGMLRSVARQLRGL